MNNKEVEIIDSIINLYKDDANDGLRNKLCTHIENHYVSISEVEEIWKYVKSSGKTTNSKNADFTQAILLECKLEQYKTTQEGKG